MQQALDERIALLQLARSAKQRALDARATHRLASTDYIDARDALIQAETIWYHLATILAQAYGRDDSTAFDHWTVAPSLELASTGSDSSRKA